MKKKEDIILGKRIKDIRINLNYDQKRFAKEIGATVSALSNWENGRNKPNMEKLSNIAKIGDTSVKELLRSHLDKVEFEKRMRNKDTELRGFIFEELVIFLNELKYSEFNYVVRESEKINKIVSLIIKSETDDKEEKLKDFVNDLVDNLMSKTYILYWNLVYELCFSEDDIQREVYVSKMLFDFLMEYLQTDERYTLPLILFTLEEAKKDIKSITDNVSNDSKQPINKVDLLKRIDDLIAFVSNINK
jgi:XRE family transcriptional regulator